MTSITIKSDAEEQTAAAGEAFGRFLESGDVVALWGDLGAGKTFLTGSIARGLGIPPSVPVTSPTFTLINEYDGRLHLYHLDLYRLADPSEMETLPWRDVLFGRGVSVIEWPDRLGGLIPDDRWDIVIEILNDDERLLTVYARGNRNTARLDDLRAILGTGRRPAP
ncbi:MAG: tRNA (adenosine(37)-N6)-threonylcarbamoyltransferase complex ATPase subunit type 1 TsaE [Syntrophobacteraceae bacterium]